MTDLEKFVEIVALRRYRNSCLTILASILHETGKLDLGLIEDKWREEYESKES